MAVATEIYGPPLNTGSTPTPPVTIDGTGLTTTVPLLIKNAKANSGVELQVTGTVATGYDLNNSAGTRKGALGVAAAANDWITGTALGDIALVVGGGQRLLIGQESGTLVATFDPGGNVTIGTGVKVKLDSNTSLTSVALQINGDANTGICSAGGADTITLVAGGVRAVEANATFLSFANGYNIALDVTTGTKLGTSTSGKLGFWNATPVVQPTNGVNLTNNVTSGGTDDTIANFTDLTTYANDAAAIRNDIYQLARKLKVVNDALRTVGLMS